MRLHRRQDTIAEMVAAAQNVDTESNTDRRAFVRPLGLHGYVG